MIESQFSFISEKHTPNTIATNVVFLLGSGHFYGGGSTEEKRVG
jgi:hypothetical protein